MRGAGVDEEAVAWCHRRDQRDLDRLRGPVLAAHRASAALLVDAHHRHRDAVVAAGDAVLRAAGRSVAHSITLAFSSSSSCS